MFSFKKLKNFDWILILVSLFLFVIGCIVIYSTTYTSFGFKVTLAQIMYGAVGLLAFFLFSILDYRTLKNYTPFLYSAVVFLLFYVLVQGRISHGAGRWIDLGFFQLQPSELAKLVMIISLAKFFSQKNEEMKLFSAFIISMVYMLVPMLLVLMQPDLGTALVIIAIWFGMVLSTQAKKIYSFGLVALSVGVLPVIYEFFLKDYQRKRILTFLNPASDPQGSGYNVLQSTIAVGSGQIFGRGLGHGPQSQLKFLPERYTDFIFSVLAEELGFLGSAVLLVLFLLLVIRIVRVAKISSDNFGSFLAIGFAIWFLFQVFVNVGMNIGIMPVTGIPLPLISAGGSSTIVIFAALGILQSIVLRHKKLDFKG